MSIADGKFHDLELSYYGSAERIDDERNKPIAYTLFRDTVNKGFINDVVSDEEMDKAHESSGSMASVHFIGTNYFSEFLSEKDKRILATGLDSKTAKRFLEAKTGAEYQKVIENNAVLQRRMLKVSAAIGTSISSANQVLGIIDSLASTSLNDTDEGREKILKAGYAIGSGIMFGEDEMDRVANDLGINLDSTETVEDRMISGLATAALSEEGYGGHLSKNTIRNKGIMGAISEDIGTNYRAIFGIRNADPYLNSRNISIEDNNVVINATEIETRVTEELSDSYDSKAGVIALAGMDMITSTAIAKKMFVGSSDSFTSKMRMSLVNESMSVGDYGASGTYGMLFGIAGAIVESIILGMIIGAVAGSAGGGVGALPGAAAGAAGGAAKGVATGIKSYKAARALAKTGSIAKKVLTSKAFIQSANIAAKTWAQTNNETGYGLAKARTLGDAKLMRNMAFDAATMYVSMGLSDRLTTMGSGRLMRTIAKSKHAGNLSGFYGGLALHNVVSTAGDISIDMGTDIIAHTAIEHAYGLMGKGYDPLLPSQESMTSLAGDIRVTGSGLLTQLGTRFASRVAGRQISRVAGWGKAKGPGNEFVVGSRLWSDNIEATMFPGAKKAPGMRMLNSLSAGIFQDNLTNISSFAREVYPDRGNAALWEMLETSPDPYKTYLALWKLQEIQTNRAYSHIRTLTSPFRSQETRGDRGIISAADSVIKLYTKDPGLDRVGQFLSLAENSSVISVEDKSTFDLLSKKIIDYVINGESNSPADMSNRLREGIAFISKRILIDEDEVFKGSGRIGTSFFSSLDQEIGNKIKSSNDNETINSLSTFMKDYSAGMKVDSDTIDLSNVSRAVLSDETLARKTNFVLNEDNKKVLEDYLVLAAEQAQQRGLTQKNLIASEIERAERLYASTDNENERRRLEASLRELRAFRDVLGYDPDGKKAVKGLETILDFFTRTVTTARGDKDRIPIRSLDELMGKEPISGISHAIDFIGAAQAFSRIYTESMSSYLGYPDERIAVARVKGFSENQIVNFVEKRLIPLISVYDAFYSSMDDSSRANARSIMKTVYGALNSRTDESSKYYSRIVDNHMTYLNSTETAIASHKDLISTMKILDGISSRSSIRELMGENANTLNMLGVLISSPRPTDSGVEIIDEEHGLINESFYPSYQNMFDEIVRDDLTIDEKIKMNKTLLAAAAARQVSLAYLDNPSRTPEQAVDIANDELSKSGLSVKVQKLVVGDNENPQIIVNTKDSPVNNDQILSELTGILEVFGKSSAAQYSSRSNMATYDALYDRTTFNFIDGKTISIQELKNRLNKDVPNAIQAIKGITIGYLSGDGDPSKIGAGLTSQIINFLNGTKFITTMTKLNPDEQAAFAWKVAKIAAGPSNVTFEYSLKGGDYVLKLGNSTLPVLAHNKNFTIIDGSSTNAEQDAILAEKGFVAVNSGAAAMRVYVQLSPAFKEHNISEVVNSLVDTYRDMANGYDDLNGSVGTFAYHAWKGMTEISADINKTLSSNPSDAYSEIIDVLTSAWNKASVSPSGISLLSDLSADAAREKSIITLSDGTKIDIREAINDYLTKGAPGLTQAVGESIASIKELVGLSGELSSEDTLGDLSVRIKGLIDNLPKDFIAFDEEKSGIIDTISRLDSQELATQMSNMADFKAKVMQIFEDIEIAYRENMDKASRLTAVKEYALDNMSNPERIKFLESVYKNHFGDNAPSKEIIAEAVRKSDEADMYSNLKKAAFREINDDAIQALKSRDPDKALANIITITMTRGTVLDFSAAEMSKRAAAVFIGKSINREEAASLISELNNTILAKTLRGDYGTEARDKAQARQVYGIKRPLSLRIVISRLPDGDNQMPPELIRAFGNYYGIEADGSFKAVLDVYGSIGKTVYSSNSSLIDPQTNTLTVRIGYDNLKRLSAAGVTWANEAIRAGEEGIHLRDTEDIAKFISSHSLHAGTYANTKQVGNTSQTDSSLLIRYASDSRQKTGSTSMKSSAAEAVSVKDAYYQSYRELEKTSWGPGYVYTAGAINDIDDNTGKFTILDNETLSRFSPTFENVMAGGRLLPSPRLEIGIKLLADLASDSMKRQKMPTEVIDVIDRIYEQHNKLVDLSPAEMVNASEVLLEFLSDHTKHPSGQHVFKTTIDGREAYFIGVTRSPTPREIQPFMPITAVLNTRENGLRLNEAGWKLFGGDFDGDLALGLAPIKPSSLARAVSVSEYGSTNLSDIDRVSKNLGDHLMSLTESSIQKNKLYDHFVSSLNPSDRIVPESGIDSNEYLSKGTQALSGAIQTLTPLKSILHSIYTGSGSIRLNNDFREAITDIAKDLATSYTTQNVQGTKFEDAFIVSPLKNIGEDTRIVFIDPSPSPDITKDSMVEIGAIGSVRYITAVDAGNTGTDGARRSVVVTELTPDNSKPTNKKYNVLVLESMKDKIGVLKVAGVPLLREGESLNKNRILNIASSLATQLRNKQTANIVELDRPLYATVPQTILESVNAALVDTKLHGQRIIMSKYKDDPNKFVEDILKFTSEAYAASLLDIDMSITLANNRGIIDYKLSDIDRSNIDEGLKSNTSFKQESARKVVSKFSEKIKDNLIAINNLVRMSEPDNTIPLSKQDNWKKMFSSNSNDLPESVYKIISIEENGGIGWRDEFGFSKINKNTELFKEIDGGLMSIRNPLSNSKKMNFYNDLSKIVKSFDVFTSRLYTTDARELNRVTRALEKEPLYIDSPKYVSRINLPDLVYSTLKSEGKPVSIGTVQRILDDIGVSKRDPETWYAPKVNSPEYILGNGIQKNKGNGSRLMVSVLTNPDGSEMSMFDLNRSIDKLITNKQLLKESNERYLNDLKMVLNGMIHVLSRDSQIRATAAAEGMGAQVVHHIRKMYKNGDITSISSVGGYRVALEGLVDKVSADEIEDRYVINKKLDILRKFSMLELVNGTTKMNVSNYLIEGDGDC